MYNTKDLINIASYDSGLELEAKNHIVADLTDIASYGKGCVSFKDL